MDGKYMLVVVVLLMTKSSGANDAMKFLAPGFIAVLEECKNELNLNDDVIGDLYSYWKMEFAQIQRDTGCIMLCMSKKLKLIDDSGKLHHENAQEYARKNGAGEALAGKMISIIRGCETTSEAIADDCARILETAKCFRLGIHELHWDPKVDVIVSEVLTEM